MTVLLVILLIWFGLQLGGSWIGMTEQLLEALHDTRWVDVPDLTRESRCDGYPQPALSLKISAIYSSPVFQSAVDGVRGSVAGAGSIEVGQDISGSWVRVRPSLLSSTSAAGTPSVRPLITAVSSFGHKGGRAGDYEDWIKDALTKRAAEVGIDGRSWMTNDELIKALRSH